MVSVKYKMCDRPDNILVLLKSFYFFTLSRTKPLSAWVCWHMSHLYVLFKSIQPTTSSITLHITETVKKKKFKRSILSIYYLELEELVSILKWLQNNDMQMVRIALKLVGLGCPSDQEVLLEICIFSFWLIYCENSEHKVFQESFNRQRRFKRLLS